MHCAQQQQQRELLHSHPHTQDTITSHQNPRPPSTQGQVWPHLALGTAVDRHFRKRALCLVSVSGLAFASHSILSILFLANILAKTKYYKLRLL
jgi:hypothetical protein